MKKIIVLNKPIKSNRKFKKFKVRVRNKNTGRINTVHFGDTRYEDFTQHKNPKRRDNFRKRHRCDPVKDLDKSTPRYWSCEYLWGKKTPVKGSRNRRGTLRRM